MGRIHGGNVIQASGLSYPLEDLLGDHDLIERHRDAAFLVLRWSSETYPRFHAPENCRIDGGARAVVDFEVEDPEEALTIVPLAARPAAGIRLCGLPGRVDRKTAYQRGEEIRAFPRGSTIVLFATGGFDFVPAIKAGVAVRTGTPLLTRRPGVIEARPAAVPA